MMQTFTKFRMPDGSVVELVDWVDKPLFSTADLLTGFSDPSIELFTYTVGDEVAGSSNITARRQATEQDTNVHAAGGMTSSEEMLVYAIRPEFFELTCATANDATSAAPSDAGQPVMRPSVLGLLHMSLILRLRITQKAFVEAGLGYFNAGFGVSGQGQHTAGAAADASVRGYASQGVPSAEATRTFAIPQHLGGTEKYQLELRNYPSNTITFNDEAGTAISNCLVRARFYLDGMRKRPTA